MNTVSCPQLFLRRPFRSITSLQDNMVAELNLKISPSCIHCNRFKGPNVAGLDPDTREIVRLFHPRRDSWADHFVWNGSELKARTLIGRVTLAVLMINAPEVVAVRRALQDEEVFLR